MQVCSVLWIKASHKPSHDEWEGKQSLPFRGRSSMFSFDISWVKQCLWNSVISLSLQNSTFLDYSRALCVLASLMAQSVMKLPAVQETQEIYEMQVQFLGGGRSPGGGNGQLTPVFQSEKSHGQRSLVDYSPQGGKELDTTKATQHTCRHVAFVSDQKHSDSFSYPFS